MHLKAILPLALIAFGTAATSPTFLPEAAATRRALSARGGAGPLNPDLTAKAYLGAFAVQGAYGYLAPNKGAVLYGVASDEVSTLCAGVTGGLMLVWVIAAWGALFTEMSNLTAIGASLVPIPYRKCILVFS